MKVTSAFEFMFCSALRLPGATGPKKHLHGHNYRLQVVFESEIDEAKVNELVQREVLAHLDHRTLNDAIAEPTHARVAEWIFEQLKRSEPELVEVALWPTSNHCIRVS